MAAFVGLISGTSMDGVDAALVDIDEGTARLRAARGHPIPKRLRAELLRLSHARRHRLHRLWQIDVALGELFAEAALALLREAGVEPGAVAAIGSHGQTVRHSPSGDLPYSIQLGDPNVIAERTAITTVADFRRRDVAAGGQGAPLVPAFHEAMLRTREGDRCVVNIGGIANLSVLFADPARATLGFDTGPGNTLLDAWASTHLGRPADTDGRWAATGTAQRKLLDVFLDDPFFAAAPPKSTGREYFNLEWVRRALEVGGRAVPPADVQRTLVELTAHGIGQSMERQAPASREVLVCGGGAHNPLLMAALERRLPRCRVRSTASVGLDPDWVEATAFAWLASRTLRGLAGNLPAVTGARRAVVLGGVYPAGTGQQPRLA